MKKKTITNKIHIKIQCREEMVLCENKTQNTYKLLSKLTLRKRGAMGIKFETSKETWKFGAT